MRGVKSLIFNNFPESLLSAPAGFYRCKNFNSYPLKKYELLTRYPELKDEEIEVSSKELAEIFECDVDNLSRDVTRISEQSGKRVRFDKSSSMGRGAVTTYRVNLV